MNSLQVQKAVKEQSELYVVSVQQWEIDFKNAVKNFFTSKGKKFLLIETESSTTCVAKVLQVLEELKKNPQQGKGLGKFLDTEKQTFLTWKQFFDLVKSLETLPKLTNLLVCEFPRLLKMEKEDGVMLQKIIDRYKLSVFKKVIFISSQEDILKEYFKQVKMRDFVKISEFQRKIYMNEAEALWECASCDLSNDVGELLRNGVNANSTCRTDKSTALHVAAEKGYQDIVLTLLRNGADNLLNTREEAPLHLAAENGHANIVLMLLENDADVNLKESSGWTALHNAAYDGYTDVVKILVEYGANINAQNANGWTALYCAALENYPAVVKMLLNFGASTNIKSNRGDTPLHIAALWGNHKVVKVLLERQVDVNIRNYDDETPLECAIRFGHNNVVALLVRY